MKRLFFIAAAIFVLGCDKRVNDLKSEDESNVSHEIVCKHPDGSLLVYKRNGAAPKLSNLPFRSRNSIWQFEGERGGKMYKVFTSFCHIEEEIK
jgi:hypothetical protein